MKTTTFIALILSLIPFSGAAQKDSLSDAAAKIMSAPSISTGFEVTDNNGKVTGEAVIAEKCFVIITDGGEYETWFDGKTQWTYNAAAEEVSMTEPTRQEILEVNPLAIISTVSDHYRIKSSGTDTTGKQIFRLTPIDNNTDITEATVYIEPKTSFPAEITVRTRDNSIMTIRFTETSVGTKLSPDKFRYKPAYHPKAEIIDLR